MRFILPLLLFTMPLAASVERGRRVEASLLIGDLEGAVAEAKKGLIEEPESPSSYELAVKSLSRAGLEEELVAIWEAFHRKFPEDAVKDAVLEELCWGILRSGAKGSGLPTRLITLIGSAITQDVYAVKVLKEHMGSESAILRQIAVELAAHFGDEDLKQEICKRFRTESVWSVRAELLKAIGELKITSMLPELLPLVRDKRVGHEEKKEIIRTITKLHDKPRSDELQVLFASPFSQMRILGCKLMAESSLRDEADLLLPLLKDSHREVRKEALVTLGRLRLPLPAEMKEWAFSKDPALGVLAAWVLLLSSPREGERALEKWLLHEKAEVRLFAAGAVASSGACGLPLAEKMILKSEDPFVKANLALTLLKHRTVVPLASKILYTFLQEEEGLLMKGEERFERVERGDHKHSPLIPNYPEVQNQVTRLELLNLLAIVEYPQAGEAIRTFLKGRSWEVVGLAAETLLSEGDEAAIALVQKLLDDPDPKMRLEAALMLATWGKDELALPPLMEAFPTADKEMKIKILESIGRLGDRKTVPFLLKQLKDPSKILRIVTASILYQTLHH